jgi:hypothetical protein
MRRSETQCRETLNPKVQGSTPCASTKNAVSRTILATMGDESMSWWGPRENCARFDSLSTAYERIPASRAASTRQGALCSVLCRNLQRSKAALARIEGDGTLPRGRVSIASVWLQSTLPKTGMPLLAALSAATAKSCSLCSAL